MKLSAPPPVKFYGYAIGTGLLFLSFLAGGKALGNINLPLVVGFVLSAPVICYGTYETFRFKDDLSQRNYGLPTIGLIGLTAVSIIIVSSFA